MKYMLLIYNDPAVLAQLPDAERQDVGDQVDRLMAELTASGEWVGGEALVEAAHTTTVKVRDGAPIVTDGPYLEAKEHLAGYLIVDCRTRERAVEIAARWPDAYRWAMEVREVVAG